MNECINTSTSKEANKLIDMKINRAKGQVLRTVLCRDYPDHTFERPTNHHKGGMDDLRWERERW